MKIVVDTSALAAILFKEPDRDMFADILVSQQPFMSAASLIELFRVVQIRLGEVAFADVRQLLSRSSTAIVPVNEEQVELAQEGMLRFGKGRREPPAALNFGDLFAYALAKQLSAPLLYKGDDFAVTDLVSATAVAG